MRLQRAQSAHRVPFARRDHGEEIADADNPSLGNLSDRSRVDVLQPRADRRRTDHAGMQHAVDAMVLNVDVPRGQLGRQIGTRVRGADDRIGRGIAQRRRLVDGEIEPSPADQRAEPDRFAATAAEDGAVLGVEVIGRTLNFGCRQRDQTRPRRRRGLANLHAADHDSRAAAGRTLVGVNAVSPSTRAMRASGTPSSSATICRIAARAPVPRSTLPAKTVTLPLGEIAR